MGGEIVREYKIPILGKVTIYKDSIFGPYYTNLEGEFKPLVKGMKTEDEAVSKTCCAVEELLGRKVSDLEKQVKEGKEVLFSMSTHSIKINLLDSFQTFPKSPEE